MSKSSLSPATEKNMTWNPFFQSIFTINAHNKPSNYSQALKKSTNISKKIQNIVDCSRTFQFIFIRSDIYAKDLWNICALIFSKILLFVYS